MHVLPHHQHWPLRRQSFDLSQLRMKRLLLSLLGGEMERRVAIAYLDRQQVGQRWDGLAKVVSALREHRLQLREPLLRCILASKASGAFKLRDVWIKRAVLVIGRAEIA